VLKNFVIPLTKALLRDQQARRQIMFYTLIAAMLMLFFGATLLQSWLREHLLILLVYWFACAWLTLLAALLAVFDLLMIRVAARAARRQLEADYLKKSRAAQRRDDEP
jgi:hypothetical protein